MSPDLVKLCAQLPWEYNTDGWEAIDDKAGEGLHVAEVARARVKEMN